jgi:hypothetical protein
MDSERKWSPWGHRGENGGRPGDSGRESAKEGRLSLGRGTREVLS